MAVEEAETSPKGSDEAKRRGTHGDPVEAARLTQTWFDEHGPFPWKEQYGVESWEELNSALNQEPFKVTAMIVDIRRSTEMMREAIDQAAFGLLLGSFARWSLIIVRSFGWWFDHFTGDGFLAYRIHTAKSIDIDFQHKEGVEAVMRFAGILQGAFLHEFSHRFQSNSMVQLPGFGLGIGVDSGGPTSMQNVGRDLILTGRPIVSAARLVSAARAGEVIFGGQLAADFHEHLPTYFRDRGVTSQWEKRGTKEYPEDDHDSGGQMMLVSTFDPKWLAGLWTGVVQPMLDEILKSTFAQVDARAEDRRSCPEAAGRRALMAAG
jgi:class 3 adenylate cyclase